MTNKVFDFSEMGSKNQQSIKAKEVTLFSYWFIVIRVIKLSITYATHIQYT
ncbi:hypothetical protein Hanom_Chr06g00566091 [Helianthus anomalus]